jgi:hypothetical protein
MALPVLNVLGSGCRDAARVVRQFPIHVFAIFAALQLQLVLQGALQDETPLGPQTLSVVLNAIAAALVTPAFIPIIRLLLRGDTDPYSGLDPRLRRVQRYLTFSVLASVFSQMADIAAAGAPSWLELGDNGLLALLALVVVKPAVIAALVLISTTIAVDAAAPVREGVAGIRGHFWRVYSIFLLLFAATGGLTIILIALRLFASGRDVIESWTWIAAAWNVYGAAFCVIVVAVGCRLYQILVEGAAPEARAPAPPPHAGAHSADT